MQRQKRYNSFTVAKKALDRYPIEVYNSHTPMGYIIQEMGCRYDP